MTESVYRGILGLAAGQPRIVEPDGRIVLENTRVWDGYLTHWLGRRVRARFLPQRDYESGAPILIVWPDQEPEPEPFMEFYYNERLVKYPASFFGHNAVNINGNIYNFSHLLNENEIMVPEEYFYRPALGGFAPSPDTGLFEITADGTAYFDKFGRNFMRTIHVIRILGSDTEKLTKFLDRELDVIRNSRPNPDRPGKYADFNFFTRSCATIIRDGFHSLGYHQIAGILPRDLFVSAAACFAREPGLRMSVYRMTQLLVPEAPPSALAPLMNIHNRIRLRTLNLPL